MHDIDFILTYLNPNDVEWQARKNSYAPGGFSDVNPNRYREWDNLVYFFRGVEKFAPWVRKVHVTTCGHLPPWLKSDHPKLNIVEHSSYIPAEWLPTFSSRCIDMNFHRIPELAEHFVYFNDDMFLTRPCGPDVFFVGGLPCDSAILRPPQYRCIDGIALHLAPVVDTAAVNTFFRAREVIRAKPGNWLSPKYGKYAFRNLVLASYPKFVGFAPVHLPYSYLKETYRKVWEALPAMCEAPSKHKFRETADLNHWVFDYWQFATNKFHPRSIWEGMCFQIHHPENAEQAAEAIRTGRYSMVCVNDTLEDNGQFESIRAVVNGALESILGEKSSFEK